MNKIGVKCPNCPDYIHKQDNAFMLDDAYGQSGIWDYKTCHNTCWRERNKRAIYESNKYRARVGLAVFND